MHCSLFLLLSCGYVNVSLFQSVVQSVTVSQLRKKLLYDVCEDFKYALILKNH